MVKVKKNKASGKKTTTLTFCDVSENHNGMDKNGILSNKGFSKLELEIGREYLESIGIECELMCLNDLLSGCELDEKKEIYEAYILVMRDCVRKLLKIDSLDEIEKELDSFEWDKQYWDDRFKKVMNKLARENVCFDEKSSDPDIKNGKGTIIGYDRVKLINLFRTMLVNILGDSGSNMVCEGNKYYDIEKCGIGWHGDSERKKVVGIRIGDSMKLCFNWFYYSKPIGEKLELVLNSGDGYIMCEKATGNDWKFRSQYTIRHSAGCDKFTSLDRFFKKEKIVKDKSVEDDKSNVLIVEEEDKNNVIKKVVKTKKKLKIIDKDSEEYSIILKKFGI